MQPPTRKTALGAGAAAILGAAASTLVPRSARAQSTTTLQFASVGGITDAGIFLAEEYGYFSSAGIAVNRQIIPTAPGLITALAANQLDVAGISVTPGLFAAAERDINIRITGDKQSYHNGFSATRFIVRPPLLKGNLAATVTGLRGKTLAVSSKASATYFLLVKMLEKFGLSTSDVKIVEVAFPNMDPAFTTGAIDGAISLEPYLTATLRAGDAKMASDLVEFAPGGTMVIVPMVYSEQLAKNRALGNAFMKAYTQGVRAYIDAIYKNKNKDKVFEIIARRSKIDEAVVRASYPFWIDPNQRVNTSAMDVLQTFFMDQQMLTTRIDLTKIVDPSFAEAAVASLGTYR